MLLLTLRISSHTNFMTDIAKNLDIFFESKDCLSLYKVFYIKGFKTV